MGVSHGTRETEALSHGPKSVCLQSRSTMHAHARCTLMTWPMHAHAGGVSLGVYGNCTGTKSRRRGRNKIEMTCQCYIAYIGSVLSGIQYPEFIGEPLFYSNCCNLNY